MQQKGSQILMPPPPSHNALVVRSLVTITSAEREQILRDVEFNVFAFPAALLTCDFLSDSGTSAMTDIQWAAIMRGDESYGRNSGYYCLLDAFRDIFERGDSQERIFRDVLSGTADADFYRSKCLKAHEGGFVNGGSLQLSRPNFFIVPQGRCAESLLFSTMQEVLARTSTENVTLTQRVVISNGFFDTTGANAAVAGFELQTFLKPGLCDPFPAELIGKTNSFKGNLDIVAAEEFLTKHADRVALILITITNNFAAAQPVSMGNIKETARMAKHYGIPLFFDACRFAENAKFIQDFEEGFSGHTIGQIVQEMFSYVDGFTISLKKDGLANMGGALCFRDQGLFAQKFSGGKDEIPIGERLKERQILCYGNDSYGGMSGRDLMAASVGLYEVTKESYLRHRISQVQSFAEKLHANGIPVLLPPGGHAIYLDMDGFFLGCDRAPEEFASVGFTLELLRDYGIRAAEAGPFAWEWDKKTSAERKNIPNLVRFAVPRNSMTDHHINYTVAAILQLHANRDMIPGVKITRGAESRLRHFQSGFLPVPVEVKQRTYLSEAQGQLSDLCNALELDESATREVEKGLALAMRPWGKRVIPRCPSGWYSDVGLDHSPIEYSVAIAQRSDKVQLRFLIEAQAEDISLAAFQESALRLTEDIHSEYSQTVSLKRFHLIWELFLPSCNESQGSFAAWHSFCISNLGELEWKLYLNPRGCGQDHAANTIRAALDRLGMAEAYSVLESIIAPTDKFLFFALDLHDGEHARVKIYMQHPSADASTIAKKFTICPDTSQEEIQRFCVAMGGSSGPYSSKPVLTCFAFRSNALRSPEGTIHFPVSEYAPHDAEIKRRIETYLAPVSSTGLARYRSTIDALQHRPLQQGRGLHSYASLKNTAHGPVNTFYVSAQLFGVLPPVPDVLMSNGHINIYGKVQGKKKKRKHQGQRVKPRNQGIVALMTSLLIKKVIAILAITFLISS
ncbi:hypothetical protein R1sor_026645 [Riccia sorocarpa]|uniref:Aromatic amino acid beta-eliminating lyase/threonine aldolase domain-containing protein n=1 Tax=Riccia sorocarpa TaxID=122646 RepID=A0ABD3GBY6_9MARC